MKYNFNIRKKWGVVTLDGVKRIFAAMSLRYHGSVGDIDEDIVNMKMIKWLKWKRTSWVLLDNSLSLRENFIKLVWPIILHGWDFNFYVVRKHIIKSV